MNNLLQPERPASAYQRAVLAALGPLAGPTTGFTWSDRYMTPTEAVCIGLGGTHVVFWTESDGWLCDRIDAQGSMFDEAHRLVAGAAVPRPEDVAAAVQLQAERRLDALPLDAAETPVPEGIQLTEQQSIAVEIGDLTEDVALRLAVYAAAEENAPV
ncbi:hypothetical protein [Kitasatospora sp. NPDC085464]|uniref:hypothetical protein n=1 Tax=Kitasatospora sp. NPDC085464 TaxID=3364063 RepID=UPI0037C9D7D0